MSFILYILLIIAGYIIFLVAFQSNNNNVSVGILVSAAQKSISFALRSVVGKRIVTEPTWYSARMSFFVVILSGFFMITFYRAVFVSFVAVDFEAPPVKSFTDISNSEYNLAVFEDSAFDDVTKQATHFPGLKECIERDKIKRFPISIESYVENMVDGTSEAVKSILLDSIMGLQFNKYYPCNLGFVKFTPKDSILNVGMIFKKNWPYTKLFNFQLLIMKENGMLDRILLDYKKRIKASCPDEHRIRIILKKFTPMGTEKTVFLYIIILAGLLFSALLLGVEMYLQKDTK